jgi:hypothetical protein
MLTKKITIVVKMDEEAETYEDEILDNLERDLNLVGGFEVVEKQIEGIDSSEVSTPLNFDEIKGKINEAKDVLSGEGIELYIEDFDDGETLNVRNEAGDALLRLALYNPEYLEFSNSLDNRGPIEVSNFEDFETEIENWVQDIKESSGF